MKKTFLLLSFLLLILRGSTSAQNPYESLGKVAPVLTLSEGKYQEFMTNDTIVQIGSVLFNTITKEVVSFLEEDTLHRMDADMTTRFLSVDPIGRKYPELTPYQFASNTPIQAIDLDGLEAELSIFQKNIGSTSIEIIKNVRFGLNRIRYEQGKYDKNYWRPNGDSRLELVNGHLPSEGVKSIVNNSSTTQTLDCAQFVQVVRWGAMLETLGKTEFNKKIGERMTLYSFGSTGIETDKLYNRSEVNQKFWTNDLQDVDLSEAELLSQAPVGSRVTVQNFAIDRLMNSNDPNSQEFAKFISKSGWARENMIKVGEDQYAAFGISTKDKPFVSLQQVKETLLNIYFAGRSYTKDEEKTLYDSIGVSQVEEFKQN